MARPQDTELARSARTDIDPDHIETGLQGQKKPETSGETGPIPPDNQPGHHPAHEQDKPDLDAFAARLGTDPSAPNATAARKGPRPASTTPAKATPAKTTPGKSPAARSPAAKSPAAKSPAAKSTAAKSPAATSPGGVQAAPSKPATAASSRPASASRQEPAPPPKIETTPAKRPASAPGWPDSEPPPPQDDEWLPDAGDPSDPRQPDRQPDQGPESKLVGLMMLPLRETVRRLEQLDKTLTERLVAKERAIRGGRAARGR